jgi:hypothetical protein
MGSSAEESNPPDTASKKCAASCQILKEDDPDLEDEVAVESGSFTKASDTVLANQWIVKVQHTGITVGGGGVAAGGGGGGTAAPNPFASIHLVPPVASACAWSDIRSFGDYCCEKGDGRSMGGVRYGYS